MHIDKSAMATLNIRIVFHNWTLSLRWDVWEVLVIITFLTVADQFMDERFIAGHPKLVNELKVLMHLN